MVQVQNKKGLIVMNKKIICVIAIIIAIILGMYLGVINNGKKTEKVKSVESFVNSNVVENNTIPTNKISESVNTIVENNNTTLISEINNPNEDTNPTNLNGNSTSSSKPVSSSEDEETPKEETKINTSKENIKSSLLEDTTPDLSDQVSVVPYAMTEDEINEVNNGNSHTFKGTVININDVAVIIKPDEGYDGISGNQITLVKSEYGAGLEINDRVEITFVGEITKTYPGNIHVVAIKIL